MDKEPDPEETLDFFCNGTPIPNIPGAEFHFHGWEVTAILPLEKGTVTATAWLNPQTAIELALDKAGK